MIQTVNEVYKPVFFTDKRYIILMGGRGGGRSTFASQYNTARVKDKNYFRSAIMRFILSDIRKSIYQEIIDRIEEANEREVFSIKDQSMEIGYGKNTINAVGFRKSSGDQKSKLKSLASYNCVIVEEADEIPEEDFMQLDDSLRTVKGDITIILLLNPPAKGHWILNRWFNLKDSEQKGFYIPELKPECKDTVAIISDYHSNEKNLAPDSIVQYENYRQTKPSHYWNMIKGYVPETVQGLIYKHFQVIDELPPEARLKRRGLDYGYTNDPTAIVDVYVWNNAFIWDEIFFRKGASNKDIADVIKMQPEDVLLIPDSAEPKSNDELISYGISLVPSQKGQGSVNQGIQYVQDQTVYITKRSLNLIKEKDNYAWRIDKQTGETINTPIDMWNHGMDAGRYAMESLKPVDNDDEVPPDDSNMFSGGNY